jgi:hypothetical protein
MDLHDDEYVMWIYTKPIYGDRLPLGIRMFDLERHYRNLSVEQVGQPENAIDVRRAESVVVAAADAADPAAREAPLRVAQAKLPGWTVEPLTNLGGVIGWILRPPSSSDN